MSLCRWSNGAFKTPCAGEPSGIGVDCGWPWPGPWFFWLVAWSAQLRDRSWARDDVRRRHKRLGLPRRRKRSASRTGARPRRRFLDRRTSRLRPRSPLPFQPQQRLKTSPWRSPIRPQNPIRSLRRWPPHQRRKRWDCIPRRWRQSRKPQGQSRHHYRHRRSFLRQGPSPAGHRFRRGDLPWRIRPSGRSASRVLRLGSGRLCQFTPTPRRGRYRRLSAWRLRLANRPC